MDPTNKLEGTKLTNFTPVASVSELQVVDAVSGSGPEVIPGARITAHYTGALCVDGTIFQSSHDFGEPVTFSLNQVIEGWRKGVPGMHVGGVRRIMIPASMAYGERVTGNIPANSDLVFDIELIDLK